MIEYDSVKVAAPGETYFGWGPPDYRLTTPDDVVQFTGEFAPNVALAGAPNPQISWNASVRNI